MKTKVRVNVYPLVFNGCVWKSTYLPHKTCRCRTKTLDVWSRPLYKRDLNLFLNNWRHFRPKWLNWDFRRLTNHDKTWVPFFPQMHSRDVAHASYFTFLHHPLTRCKSIHCDQDHLYLCPLTENASLRTLIEQYISHLYCSTLRFIGHNLSGTFLWLPIFGGKLKISSHATKEC